MALGARLILAFYEESVLYQVDHQVALHNIVMRIQGDNPDIIVPIIIHFDEHGAFSNAMNKDSASKNIFSKCSSC